MGMLTLSHLAEVARREVSMRKRVYRRWAQEGRPGWTNERAEAGISEMEQIEKILRDLAAKEEPQGRLF